MAVCGLVVVLGLRAGRVVQFLLAALDENTAKILQINYVVLTCQTNLDCFL